MREPKKTSQMSKEKESVKEGGIEGDVTVSEKYKSGDLILPAPPEK